MKYKIKIKIKDRLTNIKLEVNLNYRAKNQTEAIRKGSILAQNIWNIEEYEIARETAKNKIKIIFTYKKIKENENYEIF